MTGGAGFIGHAAARRLAAEGGRVAVADIDLDAAAAAAAGIAADGGDATAFAPHP
jgi:nucleoside-diphosphate-sugar epimerase